MKLSSRRSLLSFLARLMESPNKDSFPFLSAKFTACNMEIKDMKGDDYMTAIQFIGLVLMWIVISKVAIDILFKMSFSID